MNVVAIVGTGKGGFLLRSGPEREDWRIEGPFFKGWKLTASTRDADGRFYVATASDVYGAALQRSDDLVSWEQLEAGPAYGEESGRKLRQIWTLRQHGGTLFAGVDEAGLFRSDDGGASWEPLSGLNDHETREGWQPGFGGLCAHVVLVDPTNADRLWVGMSAVGVFRSDDGGHTWVPKNEGVPVILEDKTHPGIGYCVHALAQDPKNPDVIYRQEHLGMFKTTDGGESWVSIQEGLPSTFGFPLVMDPNSGALFCFPLEKDEYRVPIEGKFRVYRSRNQGASWEPLSNGLPESQAYLGVLRGAMAVDGLDPGGVYVGTTSGTVHVSRDSGDHWTTLPGTLPRILHVAAYQV